MQIARSFPCAGAAPELTGSSVPARQSVRAASLTFSSAQADEKITRCKLLGKQLAGAKAFAASLDPAAAGSATSCAFLTCREK